MENKQVTDYIAQHVAAGHSEATIRDHFVASGWSQAAVDAAFTQYHRPAVQPAAPSVKIKVPKQRPRPSIRARRVRSRNIKLTAAVFALMVVGFGIYTVINQSSHKALVPVLKPLSFRSKQVIDVNIIGGAIAQYTNASQGVLPTGVAVASDNSSLLLCGRDCDPTTSLISGLMVYKATNVSFKAYAPGLTSPDSQTMYIVPNATCKSQDSIGEPSPKPRAVVILYAVLDGTDLSQRCTIL